MRAVTGEVTSSNPIFLSKAAAVLSRFTASETGARPDVAAYLRRTVTAFNELVAVHHEIRAHRKISCVEEKEGATKDEVDNCWIKKKKQGSYYEGEARAGTSTLASQVELGGSSKKKVEALSSEKKSVGRKYWKEDRLQKVDGLTLVSESMNTEKKKRKHSDDQQGEVNGEMAQHGGKNKNKKRPIQ